MQLTTAAANKGNTSMEFKCAARVLAKWFHSDVESVLFQASRFVLGLGVAC